ncbi:MAG: hypothetical protein JRG91_20270, partial [Deltaproteobacteria bacterium]|nr:hypothetical protein [Deltaproteobacteria bacterium]
MNRLQEIVRLVELGRAVDVMGARGSTGLRAAVEVHARLGRRVVWVAPDVKSARQAFADIVHLDAL